MDNGLKKIKLTENQFQFLLNERLSSVLYHFTNLYNAYNIIKGDAIYLNSIYAGSEREQMHNKKKFYFCFTRQVDGRIGYSKHKKVRIEFNGDLLNQRFEGNAVDYWGDEFGKQNYYRNLRDDIKISYTQKNTENEDRLFSNEPVIRGVKKYIKRVDILLSLNDEFNDLSINSFNDINDLKIACYIYNAYKNNVFVYINEKDFNLRTNNTINEWIKQQYLSSNDIVVNNSKFASEQNIFKILIFFNYIDGKNTYNEKERKNTIGENAKILKHYNLEKFIPSIMNLYKMNKDINVSPKETNMMDILESLMRYDKDTYVYVSKMVDDFFKSHNLKNVHQAIKNEEERRNKERNGSDTIIEIFAFKPSGYSDRYGNIIIPNPNTTSFWDVFNNDVNYKKYFIEDIYRNVRKYGSKDETSFYKYLQHLTKNNISVTNMLSILNKLGFDEDFDVIDYIFGGKFTNIKLNYYTFDNQKYLSNDDKEQVKNMIIA